MSAKCINPEHNHKPRESYGGIPKGFEEIGRAYRKENQIVVVGDVEEDDENHNCDAMGCGWEHVLHRFSVATN